MLQTTINYKLVKIGDKFMQKRHLSFSYMTL